MSLPQASKSVPARALALCRAWGARAWTSRTALCAVAGLVACGESLPEQARIADARVLAIRVDVLTMHEPDPEDAAPRAQALPLERVRLQPFVVGPSGPLGPAELDYLWIACDASVTQGPTRCVLDLAPLDLGDLEACAEPTLADLGEGGLPPWPSPCALGQIEAPELVVPLSANSLSGADVEVTLIATAVGGDRTVEDCAERYLAGSASIPVDCLIATQRVDVGPIERLALVLGAFGIDLGVDEAALENPPDYDRHPSIARFAVAILPEGSDPAEAADDALEDVPVGGEVLVTPGEVLRVEVDSPESELQVYPLASTAGQGTCSLEADDPDCAEERYQGAWFRTWGQLLSGSSDDPASFNGWTIRAGAQDESDTLPEEGAWLYYVVRDGRNGVSWWWMHVAAEP